MSFIRESLQTLKDRQIAALKREAAVALVDAVYPKLTSTSSIASKMSFASMFSAAGVLARDESVSNLYHTTALAFSDSAVDEATEILLANACPTLSDMAGLDKAGKILAERKSGQDVRYSVQPESTVTGTLPEQSTDIPTDNAVVMNTSTGPVTQQQQATDVTPVHANPNEIKTCQVCGGAFKKNKKLLITEAETSKLKSPKAGQYTNKYCCGTCKGKFQALVAAEEAIVKLQQELTANKVKEEELIMKSVQTEDTVKNIESVISTLPDGDSKEVLVEKVESLRLSLQGDAQLAINLDTIGKSLTTQIAEKLKAAGIMA